jgi:hypothetical protein
VLAAGADSCAKNFFSSLCLSAMLRFALSKFTEEIIHGHIQQRAKMGSCKSFLTCVSWGHSHGQHRRVRMFLPYWRSPWSSSFRMIGHYATEAFAIAA